jgi:RHS repeat-associated protein
MSKNKPIAVVIIVAFLINTLPGAMLNPSPSTAYHNPFDQGHTGSIGGVTDSSRPDNCPCPPYKSPVNIRTGEFSYSNQDLLISGRGLPLEVTRSYNSHDIYEGPFGHGWKFNLETKLSVVAGGSQETVSIRTWDGVRREFTRNPDGSYSPPSGWLDQLVKNGDGSYTWAAGPCSGACGKPRYQFNSSGFLVGITDSNGNPMTLAYDSNGKLTQVTDASGRNLSISYGSNNKIKTVTDPASRTFTYGYDATDNLITYTDPAGNTTTYGYDGAHNLISITDARGNVIMTVKYDDQERVTEYTENGAKWTYSYSPQYKQTYKYLPNSWYSWVYSYDANGLVVSETDPLWNTTNSAFNDKLYLTSITDPKWNATSFEYDERGNRISITDALGNKTTLTYHATLNKVTGMTDPLGRTRTYDYDDQGNLVQVKDALGNKTTTTYDLYGQKTSVTNALGDTETFSYDGNGYLKAVTDASGNQNTFVYDILGNLTQTTDASGHTTIYTCDVLGNVTSVKDAQGSTTSSIYDKNSNLISMTNADGKTKSYEYDAYNRITKITDLLGNQTLRSYDVMGNLATETDANGKVTLFEYDLMNRLVKQTYPDGSTRQFTYDGVGNITKITDPKGNATSYDYDAMRRLVKITYTDGYSDTYAYDKVGNVGSWTDRKGNTTSYAYDALNRMISKTYPDALQAKYDYDALGRLIAATNKSSSLTFIYDKVGRLTKTAQGSDTLNFAYDKMGKRTRLYYPDGSWINYTYDALDQLAKISDSSGNTIAGFTYDALSHRTKLDFANGTQASYQYDDAGRLLAVAHTKTSSGAGLASFTYAYDKIANQVSATTAAGTQTVSYNQKYEVTGLTRPDSSSTSYTLDAAGNRISVANGTSTNYTVNSMNQYTEVGGSAYQYDEKGNLSSGESLTYQYDYDNNLIQVATPEGALNFAYDALGRLISQSLDDDVTRFIYDGNNVVKTIMPSGKVLHFVNGTGIDEVLAMVDEGGTNPYYYHLDSLGSVAAVSNAAGGVAESYTYDVYGKPTIRNGSGSVISKSAISNPFMFTARPYIDEARLYHLRARAYSPALGRFLQMDPAGQLRGGLNLYAYVKNNPVNSVDPLGLGFWISFGAGLLAGTAIFVTGGGALVIIAGGALAGVGTNLTYEGYYLEGYKNPCFPWLWTAAEGAAGGATGAVTGAGLAEAALAGPAGSTATLATAEQGYSGFLINETYSAFKAGQLRQGLLQAIKTPQGRELVKQMHVQVANYLKALIAAGQDYEAAQAGAMLKIIADVFQKIP